MEIHGRFDHFNFNVTDLEKSIKFYGEALGLHEYSRKVAEDYDQVRARHREMGCICYENEAMGLYFITDPDNYWIEVLPEK